jgi:threonine dehydrogenase-like Zn-dependent dehydrogenase
MPTMTAAADGSFRCGDVFDDAIRLAATGRVNLATLVSDVFPLAQAAQALTRAADPGSVIKVQLQVEENA